MAVKLTQSQEVFKAAGPERQLEIMLSVLGQMTNTLGNVKDRKDGGAVSRAFRSIRTDSNQHTRYLTAVLGKMSKKSDIVIDAMARIHAKEALIASVKPQDVKTAVPA